MDDYLLEMSNISKSFGGIQALDNVSLKIKRGSICALMGENGAGKSTLMKVLIGLVKPDQGKVVFDNKNITDCTIQQILGYGISMIHQELSPILDMTVAENIFLGNNECYKNGFALRNLMISKTKELFERLEISIAPNATMRSLNVANSQMVEIAKALSINSKLIIMDEPTSAISEKDADHLFKIIRSLEDEVSIIYITHRLEEVWQIAKEFVVLRDGVNIGSRATEDSSLDEMVTMMVGRELGEVFEKPEVEIGETILEVENLSRDKEFKDVNFKLHKGEILGIAGLMGSGRTEIFQSLYGLTTPNSGVIKLRGKEIKMKSPRTAIKNGIGIITEDRKRTGLFLPLGIRENMIVLSINRFIKKGTLHNKLIVKECSKMMDQLSIKAPDISKVVSNLSGGNQQKVLVARVLLKECDILLLDEPTRGIDVNAKKDIYKLIFDLAKLGMAIIVIASEMEVVMGVSDRVIVMHQGTQMGELERSELTQERIMLLAGGIKEHQN